MKLVEMFASRNILLFVSWAMNFFLSHVSAQEAQEGVVWRFVSF